MIIITMRGPCPAESWSHEQPTRQQINSRRNGIFFHVSRAALAATLGAIEEYSSSFIMDYLMMVNICNLLLLWAGHEYFQWPCLQSDRLLRVGHESWESETLDALAMMHQSRRLPRLLRVGHGSWESETLDALAMMHQSGRGLATTPSWT
jgi:hypothetical protein